MAARKLSLAVAPALIWASFSLAERPALGQDAPTAAPVVSGTADDAIRYYEDNGVTYREHRSRRQRPVIETNYQQSERTVYREQLSTEHQTSVRSYLAPVTEYQLQPRWRGTWNPFQQPTLAYEYVPVTRWESRTEEVTRPVVRREMIPEKQLVSVPVRNQRMVEEEVITRTAVNPPIVVGAPTNVARVQPVGGVQRLQNDPPRLGNDQWRAAGGTGRY